MSSNDAAPTTTDIRCQGSGLDAANRTYKLEREPAAPCDDVQVKGKTEAMAVFEPLASGAAPKSKADNAIIPRPDHMEGLEVRLS